MFTHIIIFFLELLILLKGNKISHHNCNLDILSILSYPSKTFIVDNSNGPDLIPAGYLAIEMINNRSDILGSYNLELIDGHAGCGDTALSLLESALVKGIFYSGKKVVGIVGLNCDTSAERVGLITVKDGIALVNVHTSSSPILDNATLYPYSTGTAPSILRFVDAFVALMQHSGWKHIGFLFEDSSTHASVLQSLALKVSQMDGYGIAFSSLVTDNDIPLDGIQTSSARVVLTYIGTVLAQKLMCLAFHNGMTFPKYQWIFFYQKHDNFSGIEFQYGKVSYKCSQEEMLVALNNSLSIDFSYEPHNHSEVLFSGLTYNEYTKEYANAVKRYNSGVYGTPVRMATPIPLGNIFHDAVWILALALNATDAWMKMENRTLCEYGYGQPIIAHKIRDEMYKINFLGASGWHNYFNHSIFTPGVVILSQFVSMKTLKVAVYYSDKHLQLVSQNSVLLSNPVQTYQVPLALFVIFLLIVFIAFVIIVLINILNVVFRELSSVKASSHRLNHLAYIGCYFILTGITILNVAERFFFSLNVKTCLCNGIPWLVSIGFTLIFGTVIVKCYRLYQLLVSAGSFQRPETRSVPINDLALMGIVVVLTVPNVIICAVWMSVDPIIVTSYLYLYTWAAEPSYILFESCIIINGEHFPILWIGLILAYEGILCMTVTFMSFLTRSISIQNFKTGNIVVFSILLFVSCGVGFPTIAVMTSMKISFNTLHISRFVTLFVVWTFIVYLCIFVLLLPPVYAAVKARTLICCRKRPSEIGF